MTEIVFNKRHIPCIFKKSSKSKYLRINVYPGQIVITAPAWVPEAETKKFLESRKQWAINKLQELELCGIKQAGFYEFIGGEELLLLGRSYSLLVVDSERRQTEVWVDEDRIIVHTDQSLDKQERTKEIKRALEKWYIEKAKKVILEKLKMFQKMLGVEYNNIRIRNQKTRWGSCSNKKNLNFNWRLCFAPEEIIEYVVVHELCHIKHMNHSKDFWLAVERMIPQYKERRKWLRINGRSLAW